jgi:hypothetical protein
MVTIFILLRLALIKWSKRLIIVVILELNTIFILGILFFKFLGMTILLIVAFTFFVGEALVMLRALFSLIQILGISYRPLFLY